MTFLNICDVKQMNNVKCSVQGKVLQKSNVLQTKHETKYFWCLVSDETQTQNKNDTDPNQIKIMFWHPFCLKFYKKINLGKIYDFNQLIVKETKKKYHQHSCQLNATKETNIQQKKTLTFIKNGILCNKQTNLSSNKLQINIKHYFKKL